MPAMWFGSQYQLTTWASITILHKVTRTVGAIFNSNYINIAYWSGYFGSTTYTMTEVTQNCNLWMNQGN